MSVKNYVNYLLYKVLPLKVWLKGTYRYYHKRKLQINDPRLFSEKLYIMKAWNRQLYPDLIKKCYDKYTVREYVKAVVGEEYLSHVYGVWDSPRKIDFSALPKSCVFKITQSSGYNIICFDKEGREKQITATLESFLNHQNNPRETEKEYKIEQYYFNHNAKIMCEELLLVDGHVPDDMRFLCFDGTVKYIAVDYETVSKQGEKLHEYSRNVYDRDGNFLPYEFGRNNNKSFKFPNISNLEEMIQVAEKLSKPFRFVRVDLYNIQGRIVFGELTWIPQGGAGPVKPEEFDKELGDLIDFSGYEPGIIKK